MSDEQKTLSHAEVSKAIREAFNAGKRVIVINGVKLKLKRQNRNPIFVIGGKTKTQAESWIIAVPAAYGAVLPIYSVELGNNLRSKIGGSH